MILKPLSTTMSNTRGATASRYLITRLRLAMVLPSSRRTAHDAHIRARSPALAGGPYLTAGLGCHLSWLPQSRSVWHLFHLHKPFIRVFTVPGAKTPVVELAVSIIQRQQDYGDSRTAGFRLFLGAAPTTLRAGAKSVCRENPDMDPPRSPTFRRRFDQTNRWRLPARASTCRLRGFFV